VTAIGTVTVIAIASESSVSGYHARPHSNIIGNAIENANVSESESRPWVLCIRGNVVMPCRHRRGWGVRTPRHSIPIPIIIHSPRHHHHHHHSSSSSSHFPKPVLPGAFCRGLADRIVRRRRRPTRSSGARISENSVVGQRTIGMGVVNEACLVSKSLPRNLHRKGGALIRNDSFQNGRKPLWKMCLRA
jgi:hypothetical protein